MWSHLKTQEFDSVRSHLPSTWNLSLVKAVLSTATLLVEPWDIPKKSALVACAGRGH